MKDDQRAAQHRHTPVGRHLGARLAFHVSGLALSFVCIAPILVILLASLKKLTSFDTLSLTAGDWTLSNYIRLLQSTDFTRWVVNSFVICIAVTALTVIVDMLAGFVFAKLRFRGRETLFLLVISTLMLPFSVTLVPTYLLVARYQLVDTYAGMILPMVSGPIGVYLMRQFIQGIPDALVDAARVDGASTYRTFVSIIAPLCGAPATVLAVFTFVNTWNNFLWPLLIAQSDEMKTLTVGIATTNLQFQQNLGNMTAQAVLSLVPTLILFIAFQRFFLRGLTAGAFKG